MAESYCRLVLRAEADADVLIAALWELGTLGIELPDNGSVVAYFENPTSYEAVEWGDLGARLERDERCSLEDSMAAYRERSRPLPIGRRLVVDPREPEHSEGEGRNWPGRQLLRLPARTAFGTGSHASTRLVLELMEGMDLAGKRVLDVGVGTGILSFAALLFGAWRVVGVEIDCAAMLVAEQNRRLNNLYPRWVAGGVSALGASPTFDLVLANVLPEHVAEDLSTIRTLMRAGGHAVFSGVLIRSERQAVQRLERAGFSVTGRRSLGDWSALVAAAV